MQDPSPQGPPNATAPYIEDHTPATTTPPAGAGRTTGAIFAGPRTISRTTVTPAAMPYSVLPTVSDHCTPAIRGETTTSTLPYSCTPLLLVTIKGGGGLPLDGTHKKDASRRDPSSLTLRHPYSPRSTPLLAETWEPSSLSRLAYTPYYKHSGCKIIQCPRTPLSWTYGPAAGTRINRALLCCLLHHHLGRGNTRHSLDGIRAPGVGTLTVGAPGRGHAV